MYGYQENCYATQPTIDYEYEQREQERENVKRYLEIFFICLILFAVILVLYVAVQKLKAYKNGTVTPSFLAYLKRCNLLAVTVAWAASLYFTILTYQNFRKIRTPSNFNFFMAASLVFIGFTLRLVMIYRHSGTTVEGPEDVIG